MALLCFISFFWSVIGVFRKPEGSVSTMYRVLQISSGWTWTYSLFCIVLTDGPHLGAQILALVLIMLSLLIFWYTRRWIQNKDFALVFNKEAPSHLETEGPFRWVRHPFYSSYLLCYFSVVLFTLDTLMGLTFLFMVGLYFKALKEEEQKFQEKGFSEAYKNYSQRTGALFPKLFARK